MANTKFFKSFVPSEPKESRFTLLPAGRHIVHIVDCVDMLSSQAFKLSDDGKIIDIHDKDASFDRAATQAVLVLVYQDEEGRIMTDFRSTVGFIHVGDADFPTPSEMKEMNLTPDASGRLKKPDGYFKTSVTRSAGCYSIISNIFNHVGATTLEELKGGILGVEIGKGKNSQKDRLEVIGWFDAKDKASDKSERAAGSDQTTEDPDDLPF